MLRFENSPASQGTNFVLVVDPFLIPRKVLIEFPLGLHLPHTPPVTITGCRGFVSSPCDGSNGPAYIYIRT
jgi:hypothetical protein